MTSRDDPPLLKVGLAQVAPVMLDREATLSKVVQHTAAAAEKGCGLVCFGEAIVPGYPVWVSRTGGGGTAVAGHYARPDVLRLIVDRTRQRAVEFVEDQPDAVTASR